MANDIKDQQDILAKLNIHTLNPMQVEAIAVIEKTTEYHFTIAYRHRKNPGVFTPVNRSIRSRKPRRTSLNFSPITRVSDTNRAGSTHYGYRF